MKLEIEGVHYHIEILNEDKEQALVFLHGFTGSSETWQNMMPYFADYKLVLIDLIGHGETDSPADPERFSMELQLRDLEHPFERQPNGLVVWRTAMDVFRDKRNCP